MCWEEEGPLLQCRLSRRVLREIGFGTQAGSLIHKCWGSLLLLKQLEISSIGKSSGARPGGILSHQAPSPHERTFLPN